MSKSTPSQDGPCSPPRSHFQGHLLRETLSVVLFQHEELRTSSLESQSSSWMFSILDLLQLFYPLSFKVIVLVTFRRAPSYCTESVYHLTTRLLFLMPFPVSILYLVFCCYLTFVSLYSLFPMSVRTVPGTRSAFKKYLKCALHTVYFHRIKYILPHAILSCVHTGESMQELTYFLKEKFETQPGEMYALGPYSYIAAS